MAFGKNNDYINELIRLGFDCNEKCLFCNYVTNKDISYFKLDFEGIKKEIDLVYKKNNKKVSNILLSFSGGEPTLWGEILIKSIKYAREIGFNYIQIQTNATIITNSFAKKLFDAGLNEAFVSLHSGDSQILDKITFLKNSLSLTISGIKNLKNNNINVVLSHVLNKLNYKNYPDFIKFVGENNFSKIISLGIIQPHGEAEKNLDKLLVSYKKLVPYIKKGNLLAGKYNINIGLHYCSLPLCQYEKFDDNLEFEANLNYRLGISKQKEKITNLRNDKIKLETCKNCFYTNYCFGVWKNYLKYFKSEIIPKKVYTDLGQNKKLLNKKEKIVFFENLEIKDIKELISKGDLVIQLVINYDDFLQNLKLILKFIKSGINVINIIGEKKVNDKLYFNLLTIKKFSKNNYPYFLVKINFLKKLKYEVG